MLNFIKEIVDNGYELDLLPKTNDFNFHLFYHATLEQIKKDNNNTLIGYNNKLYPYIIVTLSDKYDIFSVVNEKLNHHRHQMTHQFFSQNNVS